MIIAIITAISMSVLQREIPGVEVEHMKVDSVYGGTTSVQDMVGQGFNGRWSGGKQLFWRVDKGQFNANMFLTFQTPATGEVTPILFHGGTEAMNGACSAGGQHSLPIPFQPGSENQVMPSKTQ